MAQMNLADAKAGYNTQQGGQIVRKSDKEKTIYDFLTGDPKIEKAISAVAGNFFTPDRFLRLAVNAVKKTPALAMCDPQSVLGSFMTSAALGLEPNTVLQQAFLIPYKKIRREGDKWVQYYECNFQIGARGFVSLAYRSPYISRMESEAIHENDHFKHMKGTKSFLEYEKKLKDRGALIGSFCFVELADGAGETAMVLPLDEIHKIRSRSETYIALARGVDEASSAADKAKAQKKLDDTPWVMWEDDMAAKSATKKHAKQLPISPSDSFAVAAQIDSDEGNTIDMATMVNPDIVRNVMKEGVDGAGAVSGEAFGVHAEALEDNPSQTLSQMAGRSQQAETVEAKHTERTQPAAGTAAMDASHATQVSDATPASDLFGKLKTRLQTLTDLDMLDAEADLIGDVTEDAGEQDELRAIYRARREEVTRPKEAGTKPAARTASRPRGGMNIE